MVEVFASLEPRFLNYSCYTYVMHYLADILLAISLIILAAGASYFRLRKKYSYFWVILSLAVAYRLVISSGRGRDLLGFIVDIFSLAFIFFLIDVLMDYMQNKRKKT